MYLFLVFLCCLAVKRAVAQTQNGLRVHPVPAEFASEKKFKVLVNGVQVRVFHAGLNVYFASFDLTGSVDIQVEAKQAGYWDNRPVVRPASYQVKPVLNDNTVRFFISKVGQYSVERPGVNDFKDEVLFIFANPPETIKVNPNNKDVIYLKPGIHQQNIDLKSGQTLYLEAGAVLFGAVNIWNASDVRILGRGVILYYGPQSEDEDLGWVNKKNWHPLTTNNVKGLLVSGVTFIGRSRTWTIQTHTTFDAVFDNIKILAVNPQNINGDGIDWYGGGRARVTNSLIKSMDDCFAFFTPESSKDMWGRMNRTAGKVSDIYIDNCVLWASIANVLRIGFNGQDLVTDKITLRNCDIIHFNNSNWQAPASLVCVVSPSKKGEARHSNYLIENIRFEEPAALLGAQNPEAQLRNFTFRNVSMNGIPVPSMINSRTSNFIFDNVTLNSKKVSSLEDLK